MKELIPIDVLLSSFGSIEGGIIILNAEGKTVYLNEWVQNHALLVDDNYYEQPLDKVFEGDVSPALLESVDSAVNSSLSRVMSYRIHKNILPLYRNKKIVYEQALSVSVSVTPLSDMTGILIRIVDYSSLVKREKQLRLNEALLKIEKDYFQKASDETLSTEEFVASFIRQITDKVSVIDVHFSLIRGEEPVFRCHSGQPEEELLIEIERCIHSKEVLGQELDRFVTHTGQQLGMTSSVIHFSDDSIKGVLAIAKPSSLLDIGLDKTMIKVQSLIHNLVEWKISYEKLSYMATHDSLTGLFNRAYLTKKFDEFRLQVEANKIARFSLFFIDLNKFKQINDEHGHKCGDKVLVKVAQRIKSSLEADDVAFRIGGDEFVIMKADIDPPTYVEFLKQRISSSFLCDGLVMSVSSAVGCAQYPNDGENLDELIHLADEKMYRQK
ncbi:diguanylate cyclase domain-containing protein [Marinomonas posidonica]|uniref:sensor domain-containing diguanylate cyclase n=1 Tax=Marinomonas posidonica TaxID=936476 RepID=UPI00373626CC